MVEKLKIAGISALVIGLIAAGLIGGSMVLAQESGSPIAAHGGDRGGDRGGPDWMEPYQEEFQAGVAAILGLSVEELEAAREDGTKMDELIEAAGLTPEEFGEAVYDLQVGYVNQAVADGNLTQEEADDILEKMAERQGNGGRPGGKRGGKGGDRPGGEWMADYRDAFEADVAGLLGLTVEEFQAAREDRGAMEELLEAAGLTPEEFGEAVYELQVGYVNQAVADGNLTQEEADDILEHLAERQENGGRRGGKRGGDRPGGEWMAEYKDAFEADVAGLLGLTAEEWQAAREDRGAMEDLIEAAGLTVEEFREAVYELQVGYVAQAVADGNLTQEEADDILEHMAERQENGGRRSGKGGGDRPDGPPPSDG